MTLLFHISTWLFLLLATCFYHPTSSFVLRKGEPLHPFPLFSQQKTNNQHHPPFIIEPVTSEKLFDDIAKMCITVFFNNDLSNAPWKLVQLTYLQQLQASDLRRRHTNKLPTKRNCMMVARQVIPCSQQHYKTPLILEFQNVYTCSKSPLLDDNEDWVRGDVVGFCEVTEQGPGKSPMLTNLSVRADAREWGIGTKLLQACEEAVLMEFNEKDLSLEVESDNNKALAFYQKRGYQIEWEDPASRRFNTNGFFLTKEACTKITMRKNLMESSTTNMVKEKTTTNYYSDFHKMFQSIRETVFR